MDEDDFELDEELIAASSFVVDDLDESKLNIRDNVFSA